MKKGLICILILYTCLAARTSSAQQPLQPRTLPAYLYRITSPEALHLLEHPLKQEDTTFFHDRIATVPAYTGEPKLAYGHYLKVAPEGNKLLYQYIPSVPWHIYLPDNNTDLQVQLTDINTQLPFTAATLTLDGKRVPFDNKTGVYRLGKSNKQGLLAISYAGEIFYYPIRRSRNNPRIRRWADRFLFHTPAKYIAKPVSFLVSLPADGIASIRKGKAQGSIEKVNKASSAFAGLFRKNDDDDDEYETERKTQQRYYSYFFFSKPKYREHDTIRFKAQVLDTRNKQWLKETLWVTLSNGSDDYHYLGKVKPSRAGEGYSFQFVISDSMDIDLDDDYEIELKRKDSSTVAWGKFRYEDYELKRSVFHIGLPDDDDKQVRGNPFTIKLTALDENDLPLPDARAELLLTTIRVSDIKPDSLFLPDTLWRHSININNGEQHFTIPDSIFPHANIDYLLQVTFTNSEHERTVDTRSIVFRDQYATHITLMQDSVLFSGKPASGGKVKITAKDRFGFPMIDTTAYLPFSLPLDPNAYTYACGNASLNMYGEADNLRLDWSPQNDSLFVTLLNPRRLPVIAHLYRDKTELWRGQGKALSFAFPATETTTYSCIIDYVWAGKTVSKTWNMGLPLSTVRLKVEQPSTVYPGQEAEVRVTATDLHDRPVAGMEILAYAYTRKFETNEEYLSEPYLPYMGPYLKSRAKINQFTLESFRESPAATNLSFPYWHNSWRLDTSKYYRLLYPRPGKPEYVYLPMQDSITQFAPFVVKDGNVLPIQYVLVDNIPVYFGFTDDQLPYSFETDTASHQLKIRTARQLITIEKFRARPFSKTLISIPADVQERFFTIQHYPDTFTRDEKAALAPFVMGYDQSKNSFTNAYLVNGVSQRAIAFGSDNGYRRNIRTTGPVVWKYWTFKQPYQFSVNFEFEPFTTYSFGPALIRLKELPFSQSIQWKTTAPAPSFHETLLTETRLGKYHHQQLLDLRRREKPVIANDTVRGRARLQIELPENIAAPLNLILFKPGDFSFIKVYAGNTRTIDHIPDGRYELVIADTAGIYYRSQLLTASSDGLHHYRLSRPDTLQGKKMIQVDTLLARLYRSPNNPDQTEAGRILNAYVSTTYQGPTFRVNGRVLDKRGEGMVAASVRIKQTAIGTVCDIDGNFELDIPEILPHPQLIIKAIGGKETIIEARGQGLKIVIEDENNALDEVQIYGRTMVKSSMVGSASRIITGDVYSSANITNIVRALEGQVKGLQITSNEGIPQMSIQSSTSATPLIVIDGMIYTGNKMLLDLAAIGSVQWLKDATSTGMYGARAANGVLLITTRKGAMLPDDIRRTLEQPEPAMPQALMTSGLRSRFRDDAYWYPDLRTDRDGKASFKVIYPDDITSWKTFVFATDRQRHTGQHTGLVKSYKPVSASLHMPAFLILQDSSELLGKSVSYLPDTQAVTTSFYSNNNLQQQLQLTLTRSHNDTLPVIAATTDSIRLKYMLSKPDGYFDGEEKSLPVIPKGTLVAKGSFLSLGRDTSFTIAEQLTDTVQLSATASLLDLVQQEIGIVRDYPYLCNEQLASKIIATLQQQRIRKALAQPEDKHSKTNTEDMIRQLRQRRNQDKLWGWWENGNTVPWISHHVLNALIMAKASGYTLPPNEMGTGLQNLLYLWERDSTYTDIESLKLLYASGMQADYARYCSRIERKQLLSVSELTGLIRLRQQLGLSYNTQPLLNAMKEDIMGDIYWQDSSYSIYGNAVTTTITALSILQADSTIPISKDKVIQWLLRQRGPGGWRNTYESTRIIEALAQSLPLRDTAALTPRLEFNKGYEETVTKFPYQKTIYGPGRIEVTKRGRMPIYFSWYKRYRDTTGTGTGSNFSIVSWYEQNGRPISTLTAGQPAEMKIKITVAHSADFVMLDIPIPAGCSYNTKSQYYGREAHREYRDDKVSIFCESLSEGTHIFTVDLLPRFRGSYTCNPIRTELMYFPVFYGSTQMKQVKIR